jgi:hypothetical protein
MLSLDLKAIFSAYIVVYSLSRFSGALLLSFKDESVICFGYVTEGILALAIGGALTVKYGQSGMAFGILAGSLLTVGWIFPMRVVRSLRARTLER